MREEKHEYVLAFNSVVVPAYGKATTEKRGVIAFRPRRLVAGFCHAKNAQIEQVQIEQVQIDGTDQLTLPLTKDSIYPSASKRNNVDFQDCEPGDLIVITLSNYGSRDARFIVTLIGPVLGP